jgi:hypothetical protein
MGKNLFRSNSKIGKTVAQFKIDTLYNTRNIGIYYFADGYERMAGVALWNKIVGVEWEAGNRKPKFSKKKYLNSVRECSETISQLNLRSCRSQHSEQNSERSEANSNP